MQSEHKCFLSAYNLLISFQSVKLLGLLIPLSVLFSHGNQTAFIVTDSKINSNSAIFMDLTETID